MKENNIEQLEKISNDIRNDVIDMIYSAKSGHPGSSLSCVDILVYLYYSEMNLNLDTNSRRIDNLILSKGHAAPTLYAVLSSLGYIDKNILNTLRKHDSILEGHPSNKINGIDVSSGSLGQGLSIANGIALGKKLDNKDGYIYVLLGDGEMQEGQVWEALMTMNKYNLSNVICILDNNNLQIDGSIEEVKKLTNIEEKINSFGINTITCNGHDFNDLKTSIEKAKNANKPSFVIAKTIKGKGVSFMENQVAWHGKSLNEDEYKIAKMELGR